MQILGIDQEMHKCFDEQKSGRVGKDAKKYCLGYFLLMIGKGEGDTLSP
jgi:hypothetical protein